MKEIIIFARAGQGAITSAQILGSAVMKSGKYAYAFPYFGAARMGAPMNAFLRYDEKPVRLRNQIKIADYSIIVDETLFSVKDPAQTIKSDGIVVINSQKEFKSSNGKKVISIPANKISEEIAGRPLANTVLLGSYCAITEEISLAMLNEAIKERFKDKMAEINLSLAQAGYEFCKKI